MLVSTCGFGATGSSVASDYLRECSGIQVLDNFEFTLSTEVDGLEDLEHFLMEKPGRQSTSIYAIQRFEKLVKAKTRSWAANTEITQSQVDEITTRFLDRITQVKYKGVSPRINRNDAW